MKAKWEGQDWGRKGKKGTQYLHQTDEEGND
jgi:hypothetical protein